MPVMVGGRVPRAVAVLIGLVLAMSVTAAVDARMGGTLYRQLALLPDAVWRGEVWRLLTWPLVLSGPLRLLLSCAVLYVFGGDLVAAWGSRRTWRYLAVVLLAAGAGTSILGWVLPGVWWHAHLGGTALVDALLLAWARQFPHQQVLIYFFLPMRGRQLVALVIVVAVLAALYYGLARALPELLTIAAALAYLDRRPRRLWLSLKLGWIRRKLRVVREDRGRPR